MTTSVKNKSVVCQRRTRFLWFLWFVLRAVNGQPCPLLDRGSRRPPPARSHSERARPSSSGYRKEGEVSPSYREINDRFDNSNSSGGGGAGAGNSHLRDQILELNTRMRCLETRLLQQSNPSCSPPQGCARDDGEVDRGCSDDGDGGGGGCKIGSKDDLVYRSPERRKRTGDLSKRSWPPATASSGATIGAAGRRVGSYPMSNSSSNGSSGSSGSASVISESSLVFAAKELTAASSHPRRWESRAAAAGGRGSGGGGGGGGGGGHPAGERGSRRVGRRKAGGSCKTKKPNGNPPGIVLIWTRLYRWRWNVAEAKSVAGGLRWNGFDVKKSRLVFRFQKIVLKNQQNVLGNILSLSILFSQALARSCLRRLEKSLMVSKHGWRSQRPTVHDVIVYTSSAGASLSRGLKIAMRQLSIG